MSARVTIPTIQSMYRKGERIVCLTAYDSVLGELADTSGADIVLVGDSVGNVLLGYRTTVQVTLEDIVHHTKATRVGVKRALLMSDLPFGSYQVSVESAVRSAVKLLRAGAEAVKLEGDYTEEISTCVRAGIPVMAHLGMTPQSVNLFGGHRVQGKGRQGQEILETALRVQDAGAFGVLLELVPAELAAKVTESLDIPTIGIGAGVGCSGQIQVIHDVLGLSERTFRHAKAFVDGRGLLEKGLQNYSQSVRDGSFPGEENSF